MHNYLRTRLKYFVYLLTFGVFWINALEKPVFLWDVDDVLMQRTHTLHAIYSYPHKWQALRKPVVHSGRIFGIPFIPSGVVVVWDVHRGSGSIIERLHMVTSS